MNKPYSTIDVEQGSAEWHALRASSIGASDSGSIMGLSPYKSAARLWHEKVEGVSTFTNAAMQRGKDLEPEARAWFECKEGVMLANPVVRSIQRPWQIASLDGLCEEEKFVVEIKCGSEKLHNDAKRGLIPEYYMSQIQHQLSVTGFVKAYYVSYNGFDGVIIPVERDEVFIERLNTTEEAFWHSMVNLECPSPKFETIENPEGSEILLRYLTNKALLKQIEVYIDDDKALLADLLNGQPYILDGKKVYQSTTCSYDTKAMAADGVDIAKYKKPGKTFWKVG